MYSGADVDKQYEGYNYSPDNETTEAQMTTDLQDIFPYAKQSFFNRLYQLYPASDFNSTFFRRAQIYGDYIIDCRKSNSFHLLRKM